MMELSWDEECTGHPSRVRWWHVMFRFRPKPWFCETPHRVVRTSGVLVNYGTRTITLEPGERVDMKELHRRLGERWL